MTIRVEEDGTVNAVQLAEVLDCTTRSVEKYAEQGLVERVRRGRYHLVTSVRQVVAYLRKQAASQSSQDGKYDTIQESALLKQAQRRLSEIRLQQLEGTIIQVAEVEEAWTALVVANRQLVMSIPGRARMELPHLSGHDQKILERLCHDILTETALGEGKQPKIKGREDPTQ